MKSSKVHSDRIQITLSKKASRAYAVLIEGVQDVIENSVDYNELEVLIKNYPLDQLLFTDFRMNLMHLCVYSKNEVALIYFLSNLNKTLVDTLINGEDIYGNTPLHYSYYFNDRKMKDELAKYNLNPRSPNKRGLNASEFGDGFDCDGMGSILNTDEGTKSIVMESLVASADSFRLLKEDPNSREIQSKHREETPVSTAISNERRK